MEINPGNGAPVPVQPSASGIDAIVAALTGGGATSGATPPPTPAPSASGIDSIVAGLPGGGTVPTQPAGNPVPSGLPNSLAYTPDYQALLQQDPAFAALQQQLSAQGIQDAAQRQAATEQALIQFGMIPNFTSAASQLGLSPQALAMLQQDIDPNAASLAQANTNAGLSTEARLQQGQDQAMLSLRNALAANGGLSSGDDAYRTNLQDQAYAQAQQDALNSLLSAIGGYQQQYLSQQQAEQQQLDQGLQTALQFESGLPQNQGFALTYDASTGKYKDASGNTYTPTNSNGAWTLTNDATGAKYSLGPGGTLTPLSATTPTSGSTSGGSTGGTRPVDVPPSQMGGNSGGTRPVDVTPPPAASSGASNPAHVSGGSSFGPAGGHFPSMGMALMSDSTTPPTGPLSGSGLAHPAVSTILSALGQHSLPPDAGGPGGFFRQPGPGSGPMPPHHPPPIAGAPHGFGPGNVQPLGGPYPASPPPPPHPGHPGPGGGFNPSLGPPIYPPNQFHNPAVGAPSKQGPPVLAI